MMLTRIKITNFSLFEKEEILFEDGFTSLLGESGAGKTLLIKALILLLNQNQKIEVPQNEELITRIEGDFALSNEFKKRYSIGELDKEAVTFTYVFDKAPLYYLNNQPQKADIIKKIGKELLQIHGQTDTYSLYSEVSHASLLESFDFNHELNSWALEYEPSFLSFQKDQKELKEFLKEMEKRKDTSYLTYQIEEIEKLKIKKGEIEALENELLSFNSLKNVESELELFNELYLGNCGLKEQLPSLISMTKSYALEDKLNLDSLYELKSSLEELSYELEKNREKLKRLDYINERLFSIHPLILKYGQSSELILQAKESLLEELNFATNYEEEVNKRKVALLNKAKLLEKLASKKRIIDEKLVLIMKNKLSEVLKKLSLPYLDLKPIFTDKPLSKTGNYQLTLGISLNQGHEFGPLSEFASGGEASRLMLALKVIFNEQNSDKTLVFDEIDAGVSGRIAYEMSRLMCEIGQKNQLLVISHLPQVISSSSHQLLVYKEMEGITIHSKVRHLDVAELKSIIAAMLSGKEVNNGALVAAMSLLTENTHNK